MEQIKTPRLVIVTSAAHLPRAVKIFSKEMIRRRMPHAVVVAVGSTAFGRERQTDILLIPAPCDYLCTERPVFRFRLWALPLPTAEGIRRTQQAIYEWLGNLHEDLTD